MANTSKLKKFKLTLYAGDNIDGEAVDEYQGAGEQWVNYQQLKLPGFDGSQTLNLQDFWLNVANTKPLAITTRIYGIETIVKWSNTHQIKNVFTLVAELSYE